MSPERLRAEFDHVVSMWRSQIRIRFWPVVIRSAKEDVGQQSPRALASQGSAAKFKRRRAASFELHTLRASGPSTMTTRRVSRYLSDGFDTAALLRGFPSARRALRAFNSIPASKIHHSPEIFRPASLLACGAVHIAFLIALRDKQMVRTPICEDLFLLCRAASGGYLVTFRVTGTITWKVPAVIVTFIV